MCQKKAELGIVKDRSRHLAALCLAAIAVCGLDASAQPSSTCQVKIGQALDMNSTLGGLLDMWLTIRGATIDKLEKAEREVRELSQGEENPSAFDRVRFLATGLHEYLASGISELRELSKYLDELESVLDDLDGRCSLSRQDEAWVDRQLEYVRSLRSKMPHINEASERVQTGLGQFQREPAAWLRRADSLSPDVQAYRRATELPTHK